MNLNINLPTLPHQDGIEFKAILRDHYFMSYKGSLIPKNWSKSMTAQKRNKKIASFCPGQNVQLGTVGQTGFEQKVRTPEKDNWGVTGDSYGVLKIHELKSPPSEPYNKISKTSFLLLSSTKNHFLLEGLQNFKFLVCLSYDGRF